MAEKSYKLHDGQLPVNVYGNDREQTLRVEFVTGGDQDKLALAFTHATQLKDGLQPLQPEKMYGIEPGDTAFTLNLAYEDAGQYFRALAAIHDYITANIESPDAKAAANAGRPQDVIDLADVEATAANAPPNTRSIIPAAPIPPVPLRTQQPPRGAYEFMRRIEAAQANAEAKNTLTKHELDLRPDGLDAFVFPATLAAITGREEDEERNAAQIIIRIEPNDTNNPRAEIVSITGEVAKRLKYRGFTLRHKHVSFDAQEDFDSGVIVVEGGDNPAQTLENVNELMEGIRDIMEPLRAKFGSGRSPYLRKPRQTGPESLDPLYISATTQAMLDALQMAKDRGVLALNVSGDELTQWAKYFSECVREAEQKKAMGGRG